MVKKDLTEKDNKLQRFITTVHDIDQIENSNFFPGKLITILKKLMSKYK